MSRVAQGISLLQVSEANKLKVLNLIRNNGPLSRTDLAGLTQLSLPTVSRIVTQLLEQGYVREIGLGDSAGGRKPVLVELDPQAGFVIGVDLGGTSIITAVADLTAKLVHTVQVPPDTQPVLDQLLQAIQQALDLCSPQTREGILGIGIGTPGLLDFHRGVVITAANLSWKNVPLQDIVQERYGLPTFVDNDANVAALAEQRFGVEHPVDDLVYITVSTGIGAGIIIRGQIYRGASGTAGEIGDTLLPAPPQAGAEFITLEDLASGRAAVALARAAVEEGQKTQIRELCQGRAEAITAEMVFATARDGDTLARQIMEKIGRYLGLGVVNVIQNFDPACVVIGGTVVTVGQFFLDVVQEVVNRNLSSILRDKVHISLASLGDKAGVIGAATLVLDQAFTPPLEYGLTTSLLTF